MVFHNTLSNDIIIRDDIVVLLFCINESNVKNDYTIFDESKFVYRKNLLGNWVNFRTNTYILLFCMMVLHVP